MKPSVGVLVVAGAVAIGTASASLTRSRSEHAVEPAIDGVTAPSFAPAPTEWQERVATAIARMQHRVPVFVELAPSRFDEDEDRPGRITGSATDVDGRPLKGIKIRALCVDPECEDKPRAVYSNDEGNFTFVRLRPAEYIVTASALGFEQWRQDRVRVGRHAPEEIYPIMEPSPSAQEHEAPLPP
jgi:hypothetical protein